MAREYLKPARSPTILREVIRQDLNGNIVVFGKYFTRQHAGMDVAVYRFKDGNLVHRWDYTRLSWVDSMQDWRYTTGVEREFQPRGAVSFRKLPPDAEVDLTLTAQDVEKKEIRPDEMNLFQLGRFIEKKRILGLNPRRWVTDYQFKLAFAFTGFITIFLGISFALQGTRENIAPAVGKSIFALFVYYIFLMGGKKLANGVTFHPAYAVWAGNVLFLLVGSLLFWRTSKH